MPSPYQNLPPERFWKSGVAETTPQTVSGLYRKKFEIVRADKVATAGSCFAQHIAGYLRTKDFCVMDLEPPPPFLPKDLRRQYGFDLYSARYGNIYTARQLLQLAREAFGGAADPAEIWMKDGRFYDALRPNIEPNGFCSLDEAIACREHHLEKVRQLFETLDVFVFTFGLTEAWVNRQTGRVYPTAPGTIAGDFDPQRFELHNFGFNEVHDDFVAFRELVLARNPGVRFLVTVSPVPLTATAVEEHVLVATTYSKSVLRAVAGALASEFPDVGYMPSYEVIATPWTKAAFYEPNLRSVVPEGVAAVMRIFFAEHGVDLAEKSPREEVLAAAKKVAPAKKDSDLAARRAQRVAARKAARADRRGTSAMPEKADEAANSPQALDAAPADRRRQAPRKKQDEVCEEILLDAFST
jgi:hypothetical protein